MQHSENNKNLFHNDTENMVDSFQKSNDENFTTNNEVISNSVDGVNDNHRSHDVFNSNSHNEDSNVNAGFDFDSHADSGLNSNVENKEQVDNLNLGFDTMNSLNNSVGDNDSHTVDNNANIQNNAHRNNVNHNDLNQNNHQENQFLNQHTDMPSYAEQMRAKSQKNKNVQSSAQNPYQAPETLSNKNEDMQLSMQNNTTWYDTHGRIGRLRYLSYQMVMPTLLSMGLGMIIGIVGAILLPLLGESASVIIGAIYILAMLPVNFFQLYIIPKRRLHDLDQSAWLLLIMLIPLINIFFIFYLVFAAGTDGENDYGMPNRENQWWHYVIGLVAPIFLVAIIGILAAIALPAYQDYIERAQQSQEQTIENY